MDPNANLMEQEELETQLNALDGDEPEFDEIEARITELRIALNGWLGKCGFEPDWSKAPNARKYYGK
jgi:hypothetical protein